MLCVVQFHASLEQQFQFVFWFNYVPASLLVDELSSGGGRKAWLKFLNALIGADEMMVGDLVLC